MGETTMLMKSSHCRPLALAFGLSAALSLSACEPTDSSGGSADNMSVSLGLPDSLTGGRLAAGGRGGAAPHGTGGPCAFIGADEDDPLRNGYEMSKFMVSAIATWTCIADLLIDIAAVVPQDGEIRATDNDPSKPNYDDDDPTHYSVTADSSTQTTIRMYYGFDHSTPPTADDDPGFYIAWHAEANGDLRGKLIIVAETVGGHDDADDPTEMRMDFAFTGNQKFADMFLRFDDGSEWAEGFRIEVTRDLTASPLEQVFTARGLIGMKAQFAPAPGITELPDLKMFTVADRFGDGAAIAIVEDLSLPLELNATGNHLGDYLFDKTDVYFFDGDQSADEPWDWINKQITAAEYRGNRTTPATGGTLDPFDPSLDQIIAELGLDGDYFSGIKCNQVNDDCTALLNAIFDDGFAEQEPNQGADPMDWRSAAIAGANYLDSIYPNGLNWEGAFDMSFTP
jgi:hypothetical protein